MSDDPSDTGSAASGPTSPTIKLIKLTHNVRFEERNGAYAADIPSTSQAIPLSMVVKIKEEDGGDEQNVDLDTILDKLESYPILRTVIGPIVSSTITSKISHDNNVQNISPIPSISQPTVSLGNVYISNSPPSQDSRVDMSQREVSNENAIQSDEDTHKVSSTTPGTFELEDYDSDIADPSDLTYHTEETKSGERQKYMCKHCEFITGSYSSIYNHFKRSHPRLAKAGNLVRHYTKIFGTPVKKRIPILYACQRCNYITLSMQGFMLHSSRIHPSRKVNPTKQGSPVTSSVNKKYLEALYRSQEEPQKNKNKIRRLLVAYHGDSKVLQEPPRYLSSRCILCDQDFPMSSILGQHYEMCHSQQGPKKNHVTGLYHCKLCPHDDLSRMALYKHYAKSHFMDAFYAWNVPFLEPSLLEKDRKFQNVNDTHAITDRGPENGHKHRTSMERLDMFMPSTIQWDVEQSTQQQVAEDRIPCVMCDFSTTNLVELLLHYHDSHGSRYPKGLKSALLESLMLHVRAVDLPSSDLHLVDPIQGAWLDGNSQLVQYYTYECQLCVFHCKWFQVMTRHFAKKHPFIKEYITHVERKISIDAHETGGGICLQCRECGYVNHDGFRDDVMDHIEQEHFGPSNEGTIITHVSNGRRACAHCNLVANIDCMQWHYAQLHNSNSVLWHNLKVVNPLSGKDPLKCCCCDFTTREDVNLAFHYQEEHFEEAMTFTTPIHDNGYQCVLCMAITRTLGGMIRHHFKHEDGVIPKKTTTASFSRHKTVRYLSCKHCRRVFATSSYLWSHVTAQHCSFSQLLRIVDLPPDFLKYGFWEEDVVQRKSGRKTTRSSKMPFENIAHVDMFDPESNTQTPATPKIGNVKDSSQKPASSQDRVLCKFCNFGTTHQVSMNRHLISTHHHDLTFRCFKCDKEFSAIVDCIQHHLHVHGLRISRSTTYNLLLNDIVMLSQSRTKYMCAWCGYKGFSRLIVLNHFNSRHVFDKFAKKKEKKDQYYSCRWCEYNTRNATSMRAHASSKHKRSISYQSLQNFKTVESDSTLSSDTSDEEYQPSKSRECKLQFSPSSKKARFSLVQQCRINADSDFSDNELYESTHNRCKHQVRYPYSCKFCMRAFVCATSFLKHCTNEHRLWCSMSAAPKSIVVLPDLIALPTMQEKLKKQHDQDCTRSVFHGSNWPCELCSNSTFGTVVELQEHVFDFHNGRTIYMCEYCEFISFSDEKAIVHSNQHSQMTESSTRGELPDIPMRKQTPRIWEVSDTGIEIISEDSDSIIPDITPPTSPKDVNIGILRARKSIRGNMNESSPVDPVAVSNNPDVSSSDDDMFSLPEEVEENMVVNEDANVHFQHSVSHGGLIRCDKCDFYSTDSERMAAHMKCTHMSTKDYACKFCKFVSDDFTSLDSHLAEFHKIERNHQLGLQMRFSMEDSLVTPEAAVQAIAEMKSRFLYTPTPCLPILHEEVAYLTNTAEGVPSRSTTPDRFKCSYCGHIETSTFKLEMHMRRHEGNFQQDVGDVDTMQYQMNKMGMVHNFP